MKHILVACFVLWHTANGLILVNTEWIESINEHSAYSHVTDVILTDKTKYTITSDFEDSVKDVKACKVSK